MTVPACAACNTGHSTDEMRAAAIIATVSFSADDQTALGPGGWLRSAIKRDAALASFIGDRLGSDDYFRADAPVVEVLSRIIVKTAIGLFFWHFGRFVHRNEIDVLSIAHAKDIDPAALAEFHRRDDGLWPELTPSGRELERAVVARSGGTPPHMPDWHEHVRGFFEYLFLRRSNHRLLCAMNFHNAITGVIDCPWPSDAGPLRKSKPTRWRRRSTRDAPPSAC